VVGHDHLSEWLVAPHDQMASLLSPYVKAGFLKRVSAFVSRDDW